MAVDPVTPGEVAGRVAANVRELREKLGWTQTDLAGKTPGLSAGAVGAVERGERTVDVDEVVLLGQAFGVGAGRLMFDSPHSADRDVPVAKPDTA